jgi:hypothetical protein
MSRGIREMKTIGDHTAGARARHYVVERARESDMAQILSSMIKRRIGIIIVFHSNDKH